MLGKAFIMLATMSGGGDAKPVDNKPVTKPAPLVVKAVVKPVPLPTPTPTPGANTKVVINSDYVVGKLQGYYQRINQYRAVFHQRVVNTVFGKTSKAAGAVFIKKPGKMRWEYQQPNKSSYISDGSRLWSVDHKKKQVIKMDLRRYVMSVAVTFLFGKGDLRRDFVASLLKNSKAGAKGDHVVLLRPRVTDARYKTLTLVVDPDDFHVKKSIIVTTQNEINTIAFSKEDTTRPVKDGLFYFNENAPQSKNYRIIEPGKKQRTR